LDPAGILACLLTNIPGVVGVLKPFKLILICNYFVRESPVKESGILYIYYFLLLQLIVNDPQSLRPEGIIRSDLHLALIQQPLCRKCKVLQ